MHQTQQRPTRRRKGMVTGPDAITSEVAHLVRRAGFGGTDAEIALWSKDGLQANVDRLVDYEQLPDTFPPPADSILKVDPKMFARPDLEELTAWWLGRMIMTQRPLQEKMTLFWHGHFATGIDKVRSTGLMYRQNQLFRDNALGRFDELLSAVYKDPAMLIWLDGDRNTKSAPNENWGREVLELFTLGHGNYAEDDVHASSRSFTGWRVLPDGQAIYIPRLHDDGPKTLLGQTGSWDGEEAVRILAAHPATGPFLAAKLWRFFAADQPPSAAIARLARTYYETNHDMREVVRTLFSIPEFYATATRSGHIKSPTEFVVMAIRQLGLAGADLTKLPQVLAQLGQELFNPTNVGGWPGGPTWINPATMLGRFNFASWLSGNTPAGAGNLDPDAILADSGADLMENVSAYIAGALGVAPALSASTSLALSHFAGKGSTDNPELESRIRGLVHLALISPEYQVS